MSVGHGTLQAKELVTLLLGAEVERVVDVRSHPGSRRSPHFSAQALSEWLPERGISYRWEPLLGGHRRLQPPSANVGLRNTGFRAFADHMASEEGLAALGKLVDEAISTSLVFMCSESLWWKCHRRIVSDGLVLLHGAEVHHLRHDGKLDEHALTTGARRDGETVRYERATTMPLL